MGGVFNMTRISINHGHRNRQRCQTGRLSSIMHPRSMVVQAVDTAETLSRRGSDPEPAPRKGQLKDP